MCHGQWSKSASSVLNTVHGGKQWQFILKIENQKARSLSLLQRVLAGHNDVLPTTATATLLAGLTAAAAALARFRLI